MIFIFLLQIICLSPLLLINKIVLPSKLIGEVLMPAMLSKQIELQNLICKVLPAIICISLGHYIIALASDDNDLGHNIFTNDNTQVHIICSKCHNRGIQRRNFEEFLGNVRKDYIVLQVACISASNSNTIIAQRKLFAKFLKQSRYISIDDELYMRLIECCSSHTVMNLSVTSEVFSENRNGIMKVLRKFSDNIEVCVMLRFIPLLLQYCCNPEKMLNAC